MKETIKIESISIIRRPSPDLIDLLIKVEHLPEAVEFSASLHDVRAYGRQLYGMALSGEWSKTDAVIFTTEALKAIAGQVAPDYMPPTTQELAIQVNPAKRHHAMKNAAAQATHWDMMGDANQAAAWRSYYRELYALEQAPGWPLVEQWPEAPQ